MKKYTLKTIKQTKCYKANIDAIKAIYPDHVEDFARELMIAANSINFLSLKFIDECFIWKTSPQGHQPWSCLYHQMFL